MATGRALLSQVGVEWKDSPPPPPSANKPVRFLQDMAGKVGVDLSKSAPATGSSGDPAPLKFMREMAGKVGAELSKDGGKPKESKGPELPGFLRDVASKVPGFGEEKDY